MQVVERQLLPAHEHVIVGLPGLWAVTSPDAAALRTHFYLRVSKQDTILAIVNLYVPNQEYDRSRPLQWPGGGLLVVVRKPCTAELSCVWMSQGMSGGNGFGREGQASCQTAGHLARFAEGKSRYATHGLSSDA